MAFEGVASLHAARTSQRDVPTTLNTYAGKMPAARCVGLSSPNSNSALPRSSPFTCSQSGFFRSTKGISQPHDMTDQVPSAWIAKRLEMGHRRTAAQRKPPCAPAAVKEAEADELLSHEAVNDFWFHNSGAEGPWLHFSRKDSSK